ncbi:hypothetical protein GCM10010496_73550 [Streptomyces asoensis]|nr:hypothetical protein GCM10010496_73550 [Streptomyces asoensis]
MQPEPKTTDSVCSCDRYSTCRLVPASHRLAHPPRQPSARGTRSQRVRETNKHTALVWDGISSNRRNPGQGCSRPGPPG